MLKLTIHLGLFDHLKCDTAIKQIIKIRHITQKEIRRDMLWVYKGDCPLIWEIFNFSFNDISQN